MTARAELLYPLPMAAVGMDKTRRQALALGVGLGAAGLAGLSALERGEPEGASKDESEDQGMKSAQSQGRLPVVYLPHGGGPWPFVDLGFGDPRDWDALAGYLRSVKDVPTSNVRALLVISAHWEEARPTVMTSPQPPMLYDYYGFPPESYQIQWSAPGDPALAARVRELLGAAGFETAADDARGFDHGTFVPLKLTYPQADVPTVQLSLKRGLSPAEHIAMGRALAPLRDEGVFIIGSGMSYHNMRGFGAHGFSASAAFDDWLQATAVLPAAERDARLAQWVEAPSARAAHPREEHLLPMMVIAGAAQQDSGRVGFAGQVMGVRISAYHFG